MAEGFIVEVRPDDTGKRTRWPREWGDPPADPEERRRWAVANIRKGMETRRRTGERPAWLDPEAR